MSPLQFLSRSLPGEPGLHAPRSLASRSSASRSLASRSLRPLAISAAAAALLIAGCHKPISDPALKANVQEVLGSDAALKQERPLQVAVQSGVVTLSGDVSDDTASTLAAEDAAKVKGVKEVVNDITVGGVAVTPTVTTPTAPTNPRPATQEERQAIARGQSLPAPSSPPPPTPEPSYHDVTVPAGTRIPVRITETIDSNSAQTGQPFNGVVTHEVTADGLVVIPAGSAVSGRVVDAKDAAHFKGHSRLSIELTSLRRHGHIIPIRTGEYTVEGKNRGKNSIEKIGGGAAIGAVLGGIFGGGKGAAIGAAAGGGGGAAVQGFTRGQQVRIASESLIDFRLADSFQVRTSETPTQDQAPALHRR